MRLWLWLCCLAIALPLVAQDSRRPARFDLEEYRRGLEFLRPIDLDGPRLDFHRADEVDSRLAIGSERIDCGLRVIHLFVGRSAACREQQQREHPCSQRANLHESLSIDDERRRTTRSAA